MTFRGFFNSGRRTFSEPRVIRSGNYKGCELYWTVLSRDEGMSLLLCQNIVEYLPFHDKYEAVAWDNCTLRKWLNTEFLSTAFRESWLWPILKTNQTKNSRDTKDYVWEARFRPTQLKDVILPQDYRNFFNKIVESGASMNLILASSTPGTGKSTVARALAHDLDAEFLFINASDENGIETVRDKITGFASGMAFNGKPKLVILDEADGLTPQAQTSLRSYIDKFQDNCRFILTCNYIAKIIPALKEDGGRTMVFPFDMNKKVYQEELKEQILKRMKGILKFEGIPFEEDAIRTLIEKQFPSVRSIMTMLQKYSMMKGKIDDGVVEYAKIADELADLVLNKKLGEARKYINEHGLSYTDVFAFFMDHVAPKVKNPGDCILNIAQYEYQANLSSDPTIQVAACIVSIFGCL